MNTINEPVNFIVKQVNIAGLFSRMGLTCNEGSAFYRAEAGNTLTGSIDGSIGELLGNNNFQSAMRIIAEPDLYVTTRTAGVKGISEDRLHHKTSEGDFMVLSQQGEDDDVVITIFSDYRGYLDRWAQEFIGTIDAPSANYIPPEVGLEEFMLILHAVDSFRRVTYQNLLNHVYTDKVHIKTSDFVQSIAGSLGSLDIRWLLPAFMAVTPGLESYQTKLNAKSLGVLMTHDFLTEGRLGSGEEVLVFGEAGQVMGLEFLHSWLLSCGFEIKVAGAEGFKAVERFFITPTILTNHFVRLKRGKDSKAMVNHQTYTTEQLVTKIDELFKEAFLAKLSSVPTETEFESRISNQGQPMNATATPNHEQPMTQATTPPTLPSQRFCRNCGTKLVSGAKFCVNCGEKLS